MVLQRRADAAATAEYGCERFASTLAWAYWQSPDNCMQPSEVADAESAAMAPAAFRALMTSLLGVKETRVYARRYAPRTRA